MKVERALLACGMAAPVVYYANLIAFGLLNPVHDPMVLPPSFLGTAGMHYAGLFNLGLILTGIALVLASAGLFFGLRHRARGWAIAASLTCGIFGIAMCMAGFFPLPNPLHLAFGLEAAGILTPLFGAFALGAEPQTRILRAIILIGFALCVAAAAILLGAGGILNKTNAGLWSRAASVVFPTIGILCWATIKRR